MPLTPALQCLFCSHFNPAGTRFCNDCGSPLNLRPCPQCGAIDNRTEKKCYKCSAEFGSPAPMKQPAFESASALKNTPLTRSKRTLRIVALTTLLSILSLLIYRYSGPPAQDAIGQGVMQHPPEMPGALISESALSSTNVTRLAAASSTRPMAKIAPGTLTLNETPARTTTGKDCPEAVAALGLCQSNAQQEEK
jgi:hypothetical protein